MKYVLYAMLLAGITTMTHPTPTSADDTMPAAEQLADALQDAFGDEVMPEGARMLQAILQGSRMGAGEGWFGPAESRYTYSWLADRHGGDAGGGIAKDQFVGQAELFHVLDRNRDGIIQLSDLDWSDTNPYVQLSYALNRIFRRLDSQGTGGLTRADWNKLFDDATGGQETMSSRDFAAALLRGEGGGFAPGDAPTKASLLKGLFAGEIGSMVEGPHVGDRAPVFQLRSPRGDERISIETLIGEKPLVLVFGNFTCGPFRAFYPAVDALRETYGDRVNFLMVYVREAHPEDGWKMESNEKAGVAVSQPRSFDERAEVASQFCTRLEPKMPVVVDDLNDSVGHAYSGMPARLYLIDRDGRVAFKSGRGPFGFKPPELEQAIVMSLLEAMPTSTAGHEPTAPETTADQPSISDAAAWELLPRPVRGGDLPLPNWAKVVAIELPRTAAALLELDYAQRKHSPLEPRLRAKIRYVIAEANHCAYAQRTALFDLRHAGANEDEVSRLLGGQETWEPAEQEALLFARQHSLDAAAIDDTLFERVCERYGQRGAAAIVLLGAYGNFQDRLLMGLGISAEGNEPLGPMDIGFDAAAFQTEPILPPLQPVAPLITGGDDVVPDDGSWSAVSYGELQIRLDAQRQRRQRLPTPSWEEVVSGLPEGFSSRPTRIVWNLVCLGYAPELAIPWMKTTRTMWAEAGQDRVFEECLFWVQTRAVRCSYCMGHCEMLLEVAGLTPTETRDRVETLAGDDWSAFPPEQQRAFAYARKLTQTPWALTRADYTSLQHDLGRKEAMAVFFWLCRGLYMTRVSDGFQLQLESENVFDNLASSTDKE